MAAPRLSVLPKPVQQGTVLPFGHVMPEDAKAILNAGEVEAFEPQQPIYVANPIDGMPANIAQTGETANNETVTTTATVPVPVPASGSGATAAGLIEWAKQNPIPALAVAGGIAWVIYELTKKRR